MWLIVMGIGFLYFLIQGNIWGIVAVILLTAVALPGISGTKVKVLKAAQGRKPVEQYKPGDIYGLYSDHIAISKQKQEREELERKGRERI